MEKKINYRQLHEAMMFTYEEKQIILCTHVDCISQILQVLATQYNAYDMKESHDGVINYCMVDKCAVMIVSSDYAIIHGMDAFIIEVDKIKNEMSSRLSHGHRTATTAIIKGQ